MNATIFFNLAQGLTPAETQETLEQVRGIQGVFNAVALDATTTDPVISRMYFATLGDQAAVQQVLPQIKALKGVENAEPPPQRGLFW